MNRKNKPLNFLYEFEAVMDFNQYILILTSLSHFDQESRH